MSRRGVSPVVGVVLLVVITLLLASVLAAGATVYAQSLDADEAMPTTGETATATSTATPTVTATEDEWTGTPGELFRLGDDAAAATNVTFRVNFTIQEGSPTIGNSLNSVYLEVTTGSPDMFSNTSQSDLTTFGVDTDSDGEIEEDIAYDVDGWSVKNDGTALKIGLGGSAYTPEAGHSIVVVFDGVDSPDSSGTYDLEAQTSGDGNWHLGNVTVEG